MPTPHLTALAGLLLAPAACGFSLPAIGLPAISHDALISLESAFAASALATTLLHPIDTIKSRLQSDSFCLSSTGSTLQQCQPSATDASRQPLLDDLYTGLPANILKEAPDAAVYLAVCESMSQSMLSQSGWWASHVTLALLISGAIGDAVGSVLRLPAEVVCKRMQTDTLAAGDTSAHGLAASWLAILYRDVPMGAIQIATYHAAQPYAQALLDGADAVAAGTPSCAADVLAGALAGTVAAALTTPLDVLVTQQTTRAPPTDGKKQAFDPIELGLELVREQGALTLTRGLGFRIMYYAPLTGCFFGLYEHIRDLLGGAAGL